VGSGGVLTDNASPAVTVWVEGERFLWGLGRLTTAVGATNAGTVRLETSSDDAADRGSYLVADPGGFVNLPTGVIEANLGAGDNRNGSGKHHNQGTVAAGAAADLNVYG